MTGFSPARAAFFSCVLLLAGVVLVGCQPEGSGASSGEQTARRASEASQPRIRQADVAAKPADGPVFESRAAQVRLIELFTSEGCSSCPPAEAWLSRLTSDDQLWDTVVPVAFHVDYWNDLGWKDPFSSAAYSRRQRRYAAAWQNGRVYTPGFVLNGEEWRGWFEGRRSLPEASEDAGVLRVALNDDGKANARFAAQRNLPETLTLNVAVLGSGIAVDVEAGENRGRELAHDFVVLGHQTASLQQQDGAYTGTVALPSADKDAERYALAAWVSRPGTQAPLQATGGWLSQAHARSEMSR